MIEKYAGKNNSKYKIFITNKIIPSIELNKYINKTSKVLIITDSGIPKKYIKALKVKIKNARVGTIDKFQGQEAPVNIISMTSSDSETLPRNKEFFFDKNRLNVAISRAQVASIILFNPKLLEFSPKNINQIKLMNNFFKLLDYKVK